jgi:DNA invertase Pin-like site-specific DNA recombinase
VKFAGPKGKLVEALGYIRTSSAGNVGEGKDSEAPQRKAIENYAKRAGMVIVAWFYDAAVSGAVRVAENRHSVCRMAHA